MNPLPHGFALGAAEAAVRDRLQQLESSSFAARLWAHDDALWGGDPARRKVAASRLGWLESPAAMRDLIEPLEAFAREARRDGLTHAVLLGMGGSSLAPEVLRRTFGAAHDALDLTVLDSTSPAAVRAVDSSHDPAKTLFVVSSKSGGTLEVNSFERHFWSRTSAAVGARQAGRQFVAITDSGTALERLAAERGYRRTFINPGDIGGRYSALSYFGLVPAALIGMDVTALVEHALEEAAASHVAVNGGAVPSGYVLGAALGELARRGRDKLTFVLGPELAAFASWAEQLLAESTGKEGKGIVPIAEEHVGLPDVYGDDRAFAAFSVHPLPADVEAALDALAAAGHPVLRWRLRELAALGAEFLRWEIATATAGAILGIDPFDEPNVTEAKQATQAVLEREQHGEQPHAIDAPSPKVDVPELIARELTATAGRRRDPAALAAALVTLAKPGDYFAVLAYVHRTPARHDRLQRLRHAARGVSRLATTLGYGPRFLHSTGQLHKGGPPTGIFLQLTADDGPDVAIPDRPFSFGQLIQAQAAGDYEVLERRGRRVLHVHLGNQPEKLIDEIADALAAVRV